MAANHRHENPVTLAQHTRFFEFGRAEDGSYPLTPELVPRAMETIGTGQIGGKARGLAFAMKHVEDGDSLSESQHLIRFPESTVLTTEVFDDFVKENKLQRIVQAGCEGDLSMEEVGEHVTAARLPDRWCEALAPLLEREKRPLAVRSSSIMEDDPNHSFAGIYLSDFLPNRGTPEERLDALVHLIKRVYASTFAPNARAYRKRHGLDWQREKMAILIQNMIGSLYSHGLFYPLVGGVAFSHNFYPWTERLRTSDGIVRLVVGVGTRAVGREYARVFSPRLPGIRPEGSDPQTIIQNSQETVDVLDFAAGHLSTRKLYELGNPLLTKICSIVSEDGTLRDPLSSVAMFSDTERLVASFTRLIEGRTLMPFTQIIRELFASLESLLEMPVDIEFALDFSSAEASEQRSPLLYMLQVRPLGSRSEHRRIQAPKVHEDRIILQSTRALGNGEVRGIKNLLVVDPEAYRWDKAFDIARTVGRLNQQLVDENEDYILIGPGRWATSNPQLGVPVQYGEISGASVIVEMTTARFSPELSYGTHFYADMVGSGVLYLPLNTEDGDRLDLHRLTCSRIAYRDDYVTHYVVDSGMDVYVDGQGRESDIILAG